MPLNPAGFLKEVLEEMMAPEVRGIRNWHNIMAATEHAYYNPMLRKMMADPFKSIILGTLKNYVEIATDVFPEQAKCCKAADANFFLRKMSMMDKTCTTFCDEIKKFDFPAELDLCRNVKMCRWRLFFHQIEDKMYFKWCRKSFVDGLPPISIDLESNFSNYALEIIYYTADCVLRKIEKSAKNDIDRKDISISLFNQHSVDVLEAEQANLPIALTKVSNDEFYFLLLIRATIVI